jgi:hypothetical protein
MALTARIASSDRCSKLGRRFDLRRLARVRGAKRGAGGGAVALGADVRSATLIVVIGACGAKAPCFAYPARPTRR